MRAALKLLCYFAALWVLAAAWPPAAEWFGAAVASVHDLLRAAGLPGAAALTGLLAVAGVLGGVHLACVPLLVLAVPVDAGHGPLRHPFPEQPLRIRLRWRRPRFVLLVLVQGLALLLALRALPLWVDAARVATPAWATLEGWEAGWVLYGGLHAGVALFAWLALQSLAVAAARASPVRYGFVRYQRRRQPLLGCVLRLIVFVQLPLAAFSANALAHPWLVWLVLAGLGSMVLAALLAQLMTLLIEARRDRWLAGLAGAAAGPEAGFIAARVHARSVVFLHPDQVDLSLPQARVSAAAASPDAVASPDAAVALADAHVPAAAPAEPAAVEAAAVETLDEAAQGRQDTTPAAVPDDALAAAEVLRDAGTAQPARALLDEVVVSGEPAERVQAERMLRTLPRRWYLLRLGFGLAAVAGLILGGLGAWQWFALPSAEETLALARSAHVHVRKSGAGADARIALLGSRYDYSLNTSLDNISEHFVNAVVASEDHRYFEHGSAYKVAKFVQAGALCALRRLNIFASAQACAGNSTIAQQLARNLFLSESRSVERKLKELLWAIKMDAGLDKRTVLELYMNRIYLGRGNFGVELAARDYFNRSAADLDLYESALLAAAVKRPGWNWREDRAGAMARARLILSLMRRHGHAPAHAAYPRGWAPRMGLRAPRKPYLGHLWQWIQPQVEAVLDDLPAGDYKVLTTLNAEVEVYAERHLGEEVERLARGGVPVSQGAVVVMRPDGAVLAMVGGVGDDLGARGLNRAKATRGLVSRPPASAFKPFVYMGALEQGLTPATLIDASPVDIPMPAPQPPYRPRNHDGRSYAAVTMHEGLVRSINTAAVHLLREQVGFDHLFDVLRRAGIDASRFPRQWGVALGAAGVPLLQMTGAYAVFAGGGARVQPHAFAAITTAEGKTVWRRPRPAPRPAFNVVHVRAMNQMLRGVVDEGTGMRAREGLPPGLEVAGKTGTGDGHVDAWFLGYTGDVVIGVWLGNDIPRGMPGVYGGTAPARVFNRILRDLVDYTDLVDERKRLP